VSWRRRLLLGLVAALIGVMFAESYRSLIRAAVAADRPAPWLWPTGLELFTAVLILTYWDARAEGRSAWGARLLLLLTTGLSAALQVLDAPHTALGMLTAGWTPVSVLLSIELGSWLLYGRRDAPAPVLLSVQVEEEEPAVASAPPPVPAPPAPPLALEEGRAGAVGEEHSSSRESRTPAPPRAVAPARRAAPPRALHAVPSAGLEEERSAGAARVVEWWAGLSPEERSRATARQAAEGTGLSQSYCGKRLARLRAEPPAEEVSASP
jgi:hypothetical protein